MNEKNTPKEKRLLALLSEDSANKLNEVSSLLAEISNDNNCTSDAQEFWAPLAVVEGSCYGETEVYGIPCHYYHNLCRGGVKDFDLLVKCLMNISSSMVVHEVLLLLTWSLLDDDEIAHFIKSLSAIGIGKCRESVRVIAFAVRAIVEGACENRGRSQYILRSLVEMARDWADKTMLVLVLGYIVYELRGDDRRTGQPRHDELVCLLEMVKQVIRSNNLEIQHNEISYVFGFSLTDNECSRICRETGKPAHAGPLYAQALITIVFAELHLDEKFMKDMVEKALEFPDVSYYWTQGNRYVLSVCIGATIAGSSDAMGMWQELRQDWNQVIYRDFHECGFGVFNNVSSICDLYLRMAVSTIEGLLSRDNITAAEIAWEDAWNDCITSLWCRLLPGAAVEVVQYLFVFRALYLSHLDDYKLRSLIATLPIIESRSLEKIDCRSLCQSALKKNCSNEEYLRLLS